MAVIFRRKAVFRFLAVTIFAGAIKRKNGRSFSAVGGFLFFGGNMNGDPKLIGNFDA